MKNFQRRGLIRTNKTERNLKYDIKKCLEKKTPPPKGPEKEQSER